jgi:glycosyltransferase involved in cell wall biosynthesis
MLPSVSLILPVGYGDRYFQLALACAQFQTYEGELEIVIVDNSDTSIVSLIDDEDDERIKYHRCERMPVGALRNLGTSYATGEVCISWDEDDWSAMDRVESQVNRLLESGKAVTGWHNIQYHDASTGNCYKYSYAAGRPHSHEPYACGTSQCYRKSWWGQHPFRSTGVEDYRFQLEAAQANQLDSCDAEQLCVARAHEDSKCPLAQYIGRGCQQFAQVSRDDLPKGFWADIARIKQ